MKKVIILRGVSGSGKTTFAENCISGDPFICCADNYFLDENGEYKFDINRLGNAHRWCQEEFKEAVRGEFPSIVVANTNTSPKEFTVYEDFAKEHGYKVFHVVLENRHGNNDVHNVPSDVKDNQATRLENSLKL